MTTWTKKPSWSTVDNEEEELHWVQDNNNCPVMYVYLYVCMYVLDAITSLGIVFGKLKLGRTFDFDKQDAIDYKNFSKPIPCAGAQKQSHKSKQP